MIGGPLSFVKRLLSAYQYPKSPCFCPRDAQALCSGDQVGYRLQTPAGHVALQIMIALPAPRGGEVPCPFLGTAASASSYSDRSIGFRQA